MGTEESMGDEVYQPDRSDDREIREDHGVLDREDLLSDRAADPYDEGYSPPERPLGAEHVGTTAREQREGETLDQRLAEEVPDPALRRDGPDPAENGIGDLPGGMGEPYDDQVGRDRSGRLVAPDEGVRADTEKDVIGRDVGVDGGAASAEEAAVHEIPPEDERAG
ncbi:DUF5709 domain-containing protein [Streptomyces sp. TRM49041]|uniref:DUF5709 domain-containing protein n=1 Tax=Streptomyces sp. TRM49041 TaxID=2603216 RepID=UPI0011EDDE94|nr:DUF5709 domain-containing protein [Streptomyces sp. TRM49041]